jgi:methyl-accepting chemotaxis protein
MFVEFRETFQRAKALRGARRLADRIKASMAAALRATRAGLENAEDQTQPVQAGAGQLQKASRALRDTIGRTRGVRVEWTEGLDRLERMVARVREKFERTEGRMENLESLQGSLDALGFQTNMSSLNAIVNAARTENRGEIFAAVAEEARAAAAAIRGHIAEILHQIGQVNTAIGAAGERFQQFDAAMAKFRRTSEAVSELARDIVGFSHQQEEALAAIGDAIQAAGACAFQSRGRYRNLHRAETDIRRHLDILDHILTARTGFWGPYRLNKKISLDKQRVNVEGIREIVETHGGVIQAERTDLVQNADRMASAAERLESLRAGFGRFADLVSEAREKVTSEAASGVAEISTHARELAAQVRLLSGFLEEIRRRKERMAQTVLFNDLLPVVAKMAALLAEGEHDLQFRVLELTELLHKLRDAAGDIEGFLRAIGAEVAEMETLCAAMESEMDAGKKSAAGIGAALTAADETTDRQREQIDAIETAIQVIQEALEANRSCAGRIEGENGRVHAAIGDYIAILDVRRDRRNGSPSPAPEPASALPPGAESKSPTHWK